MDTLARPRRRPVAGVAAGHLEAYVVALVNAAPPLTPEQVRRLRSLLERARPDAQP